MPSLVPSSGHPAEVTKKTKWASYISLSPRNAVDHVVRHAFVISGSHRLNGWTC